jgi:hypothetical protein
MQNTTVTTTTSSTQSTPDLAEMRRRLADSLVRFEEALARVDAACTRLAVTLEKWGKL